MGQQVAVGECAFTRKPHICQVLLLKTVGQHRVRDGQNYHFSILTIGQSYPPARSNTQA